MKIETVYAVDDYDGRSAYKIIVDGVSVASFHDGEPEDASLSRDFNDVFKITELMDMAYEAGKRGEEVTWEDKDISWSEFYDY